MVPVMMIRMMAIGGVMIPDHAAAEHQAQDNQETFRHNLLFGILPSSQECLMS